MLKGEILYHSVRQNELRSHHKILINKNNSHQKRILNLKKNQRQFERILNIADSK